ncbi:MAG: NUDIX hydrolase [Saprospiraceae bacterium]|nr:NUDIX hydrolase [Saprospiraceae bacterium]
MTNPTESLSSSLTVDCVIFGLDASSRLKVLLIQRGHEPFEGAWALPGGFVAKYEPLEDAASRILREETGVSDVFIEQLYTVGTPNRDPRGRVVTVVYYALINLVEQSTATKSDNKAVEWYPIDNLPQLAFDHADIMKMAIQRLRGKVRYQPIGFELLPESFTLTQLQNLYETILGKELNKRNFRTKILKMDILKEGSILRGVAHRPAQLYRFDEAKYQDYVKRGFNFEL